MDRQWFILIIHLISFRHPYENLQLVFNSLHGRVKKTVMAARCYGERRAGKVGVFPLLSCYRHTLLRFESFFDGLCEITLVPLYGRFYSWYQYPCTDGRVLCVEAHYFMQKSLSALQTIEKAVLRFLLLAGRFHARTADDNTVVPGTTTKPEN